MASLKNIGSALAAFERHYYYKLAETQALVAAKVLDKVAHATPVRTSRCQQNWTLSDNRNISIYDPVPRFKADPGDRNTQAYRAVRSEALNDVPIIAKKISHGKKIGHCWVTNPTPYLRYLDAGHSRQAPAGWIDRIARRRAKTAQSDLTRALGFELARDMRRAMRGTP